MSPCCWALRAGGVGVALGTPSPGVAAGKDSAKPADAARDFDRDNGNAGYEVVRRETAEPDWTHVVDAGDTATLTIDLSKDNAFFGVRTYDRDGNRSPVAFPGPSG